MTTHTKNQVEAKESEAVKELHVAISELDKLSKHPDCKEANCIEAMNHVREAIRFLKEE